MLRGLRPFFSVAVLCGLIGPASAAAVPPAPFGHACGPQDGVLFCPTADDPSRVPAFDGVPLDVDVTLPSQGDGPFPTLVMLHGYGGSKTAFEAPSSPTYDNVFYAQRGYAVVNPSARGFGRSCGAVESRTPDCARGWVHLADQRYEARDVQELLGRLVDEGVAKPDALGVTGVSYGGGQSLELAYLRDRVRLPDGSLTQWRSPAGTPLAIAAAFPRWPWFDLAAALVRNGRRDPLAVPGVPIKSYLDVLYAAGKAVGQLAPAGADPGADLDGWNARLQRGEPYGADVARILRELHDFHGASGLAGSVTAPLLIESGWTDDLFPTLQGKAAYADVRKTNPNAPVGLIFGDLGHSRGANHPQDKAAIDAQALSFLDQRLRPSGLPSAGMYYPGPVTAYLQTCPKDAPRGGGPVDATSLGELAPYSLVVPAHRGTQTVRSTSVSPLSAKLDPLKATGATCVNYPAARRRSGTAELLGVSPGFVLLGSALVSGRIVASGAAGQLAVRLWDVDVRKRTQQLVDRGVYRVTKGQSGRISFVLDGNGYRFAKGHTISLEVLGSDAPTYRASEGRTTIAVRDLSLTLPTPAKTGS